jgi:hypothetical protein
MLSKAVYGGFAGAVAHPAARSRANTAMAR